MTTFPREPIESLCDEVVVGHVGPSSGHRVDGGIPFLMGKNIGEGFLKLQDLEQVTPEFHHAQTKSQLRPGDVVVVRIGKSGQAAKIPDTLGEANCSGLVVIKRPRKVTADFLVHFLNSPEGRRQSIAEAKGSTRQTLNTTSIAACKIPVPPLPEQCRIAEVLDCAEALRAKRRVALAELDTLTQSIFLEMFGDPRVNAKKLPLRKLGEVGVLDRGVSRHRPRNAPELLGGAHPLVQTGEIANCDGYVRHHEATYSDLGLRQSKIWPRGTLCITIAANIAKAGILTFDACFPDSVVGFLAEAPETVEFVRTWISFLQKSLEDRAPESAQKNINLGILRDLDIPFPPIELQTKFAQRVAAVEKLKIPQRASLNEQNALFASLQHRAFRGEL